MVNDVRDRWFVFAGWNRRGVCPGGAGYLDGAVEDLDVPVAGVEVEVMALAEQGEVGDGGRSAVEPGDDVVRVGPTPFSRTPVTVV